MTHPETQWTLEQFGSVISNISAPLKRVDRDESRLYDGDGSAPDMSSPIRGRKGDLQRANFVGVQFVDRVTEAIGTEYDHDVETVVSVRVEGLHESKWGYIDPDGVEGIEWSELTDRLQEALTDQRTWPAAGDPDTVYTDLQFANESDSSDDYRDAYRADWDVVFNGYEDL